MERTYELPPSLPADLESFREQTERFKKGEISATQYRAFRVPQGIYEQRQDGAYMLRVRLPAGRILPHQMHKLADVARKYGSGKLHVTTRQDIQVHDVSLDHIHRTLVELFGAGLSTKGGGGNTVRNITACPDAGVCPKEVFDVSPSAVALTEFLLPDPVSYQLPRKYKIAFSGCSDDCIGAAVNDLGFIAKPGEGGPGYAVYTGGGLGPHARVGQLLEAFVPVDQAHLVAEAVKRVFDKHGNRKNKQRARLRYLVEEKGSDAFRALYRDEFARLRKENPAAPTLRPVAPRLEGPRGNGVPPAEGFDSWQQKNVSEQKQPGYYLVHVPVFLGEVAAGTMEELAEIAEHFGEGTIRTTPSQNLVFRWIGEAELPSLHRELSKLGLAASVSPVLREMIACTGANTCRLGICLSQGLAAASREALENAGLDLDEAVSLRLNINGCPNSCGRHAVASIGLVGAARRLNDRLTPHYMVQLGGSVGEGHTKLATGNEMIPARNLPTFLVEFLRRFRGSEQYPDFDAYLESDGRKEAARIAGAYKEIPTFEEDETFYYDWGADQPFSLAGRGPGECSAGVFDLIRVDLTSAQQAFEENRLLAATTLAARAMLITQGEEAKDGLESLRLFEKHFLDPGHIDASFRDLNIRAREALAAPDGCHAFRAEASEVAALIAAVENLYENMDQSLRFHKTPADGGMVVLEEPKETSSVQLEDMRIDREADFREVTCPLNYVKTKLLLGQMKKGQVLSVLLDEAGGKSVPRSAEKDGHEIVAEQREGDRWRVIIRKG